VEIVKDLIRHGARVSSADSNGNTPLISAVLSGDQETVKILLQQPDSLYLNDRSAH